MRWWKNADESQVQCLERIVIQQSTKEMENNRIIHHFCSPYSLSEKQYYDTLLSTFEKDEIKINGP